MKQKNSKVFITGGTGFIGKPVVRKLEELGYQVLLLSRSPKLKEFSSNVKVIKGDLGNILKWRNKLKEFGPDGAIHMAWEGMQNHSIVNGRLNLEYGLNLTQLLADIGCKKMIVTSSCWEYGAPSGKRSKKSTEEPFNIYGAVKKSLHLLESQIADKTDMKLIWARLFYAYGPGQYPDSLIPHVINSAKQGKRAEIRSPEAKNDFVFVEDIAGALCQALEKIDENDSFDIGSGKLTSIATIVSLILKEFGVENNYKKTVSDQEDKFTGIVADTSKIREKINWKPMSIKEGIKKTVDFYR